MITKKTKVVGFTSILFFVTTCIVLFAMWQYIQTKGGELLQQTKEIADFKARDQTYNELEKLLESTRDERDELTTYVLTEGKTIDFLATIEQVAVEQGIDLSTDSLKVVKQEGSFDTLLISFSVDGEYSRVQTMLEIFEILPYHAFVSAVSFRNIEKEGVKTTQGTIELKVSLLEYD